MSKIKTFRQLMIVGLVALTVGLVGCSSGGKKENSGRTLGTVIGVVLGAAAGGDDNRVGGAILGGVLGNLVGGAIGKSMDARDRSNQRTALERNQTNQPMAWTNPDSGNKYRVTPTRTYRSAKNMPCREYETEAFVRGQRKVFRGKACRDTNGNWTEVRG